MEEHEIERELGRMRRAEAADLSELESTVYGLDDRSVALRAYIENYGSFMARPAREHHLRRLETSYTDAFGRFTRAIARDPVMDQVGKRSAVKTVYFAEETLRSGAIAAALPGARAMPLDEGNGDAVLGILYTAETFDSVSAEEIAEAFKRATDGNIGLFVAEARKRA